MSNDRDIFRDADRLGIRPLTARSVLVSFLLGSHPPRLPVRALVAAADLFAISESSVRTALSRMAAVGDVRADDGWYELAGGLLRRQARQDESRIALRGPWDGTWSMVVSTADRRPAAERAASRALLSAARFAELREGVWVRPTNLERPDLGGGWTAGRVEFDSPPDPADLWDLAGWADRADALRRAMADLGSAVDAGDRSVLGRGFVVAAAVLRHYQTDPLLPDELRPPEWPGDALRSDYDTYDPIYRAMLREFFRS